MSSGGRLAFLEQISSREKALVVGLLLFAIAVVVFVGWLFVESELGELQDEITINDELIAEIESTSETFVGIQARCKAIEQVVRENPIASLRIPVNNIARGVTIEGGRKLADEIGSLKQQSETRIGPICEIQEDKGRRRKKGSAKETEAGIVRVEQDFEFRNISLDAIFSFLDGIERSKDLLFVTQLDIRRKFGDPEQAQTASIRVATYRMEGEP